MTSLPVRKGFIAYTVLGGVHLGYWLTSRLTCNTIVAIKAQKKLRSIVLLGKFELISSRENSTPPIGDPKATATPAALDADKISLIFANKFYEYQDQISRFSTEVTYLCSFDNLRTAAIPRVRHNTPCARLGLPCQY